MDSPVEPYRSMIYARFEVLASRPFDALSVDEAESLQFFQAYRAARSGLERLPSPDRYSVWAVKAITAERWIAQEGRTPVENNRRRATPQALEEKRLAEWLRHERRSQAHRCSFQRMWLKTLPTGEQRQRTRRWHFMLRSYRWFVKINGRAPRYRSTDITERRVAAWAAKQRWRYRTESLNAHRVSQLEALRLWSWGTPPALSPGYVARVRVLASEEEGGRSGAHVDLSGLTVITPVPPR